MIYDRPIDELLVEFARQQTGEFNFEVVRTWFARHYPKIRHTAVRAHLHSMTYDGIDKPGGMWPIFEHVRHGAYRVRPNLNTIVRPRPRRTSGPSVWSLLEKCTREIGPRITVGDIYTWFRAHEPDVRESTLTAHIYAAVLAPDAKAKIGHRQPYLRRLSRGQYEVVRAVAAEHVPGADPKTLNTLGDQLVQLVARVTPLAPTAAQAYLSLADARDPASAVVAHIAAGTSPAFHSVRSIGRLDLTVEALVCAHRPPGMPPEAIATAQERLRYYGAAGLA